MTLTLDFQGQILKMLYLRRNGGTIGMEQKGCESIGCYTHFVTFNVWIFKDKFWKSCISGMDGWLTWNERDLSG